MPCFIRYAKELPTNRDVPELCAHMDLLPTLARLCQLDTRGIDKLDGTDLVDHIKQFKPWPERTLIVQSHRVEEPVKFRKSVVMRGRWRLVDGEDLYDLQSDPGQTKPLPTAENAGIFKSLLATITPGGTI